MEANPFFFRDLAYVFLAAIFGGMLAWRLRQPLILGYVLAGIFISPLTPGPSVSNVHTLELFAEIGVVLLMFSVGLEFSPKDLLRAKWVALVGGPIGILLSMGLGLGVAQLTGWSASQGIVVGAIISVASTMVLTRLLLDHGQLRTEQGRIMVAITLVEDLAVVILIVLIPGFGSLEASRFWIIALALGKAMLILAPAIYIAARIIPPLLRRVAQTQSQELFFVVVLAICLGTAALTQAVGLSLALGAFVAGLMISGSDYAHETLAQLFPLRDAFVALFFVTIGLLIDPRTLFSNLPLLAILLGLIVVGKMLIWISVVRLFGYDVWTALTVAIGLTQIGEFSFILVQVARNSGIVGNDIYNATLAASLASILINAALVRFMPVWIGQKRLAIHAATHAHSSQATEELRGHVVICGFGRVGGSVGAALGTFGVPYVVIELDPDIIQNLRTRGIPCVFGDPVRAHVLKEVGTHAASLIIMALPDPERARLAILNVRQLNPDVPILARAHRRSDHEVLSRAGASEIIQPEIEASATMIRHASSYLKLPDDQTRAYLRGFRVAMDAVESRPSTSQLPFPEARELAVVSSEFAGKSLRDAQIRKRFGVTILAITRASGEVLVNPPPETILMTGDKLRIFGPSRESEAFAAAIGGSKA